MSEPAIESRPWSHRRWLGTIGFAFLVQVGLIFWLGSHKAIQSRVVKNAPALQLSTSLSERVLALSDPTLFALPHEQSFSGPAWMRRHSGAPQPPPEEDCPDYLQYSAQPLPAALKQLAPTGPLSSLSTPVRPEPALSQPEEPVESTLPQASELRLFGTLAHRHLLTPLPLRSWGPQTNAAGDLDLLSSSLVQAVVDAEGRTLSATLLRSSGLPEADQYALDLVRAARFEPLAPNATNAPWMQLNWGKFLFEWHTLPLAETPIEAQQ